MVELKKVELDCTKEAHEMGEAMHGIVLAYKKAVADGFQAGQDVPAIVLEALPKLLSAMDGAMKLGEESKMTVEFINAWMVSVSKVAGEFIKK